MRASTNVNIHTWAFFKIGFNNYWRGKGSRGEGPGARGRKLLTSLG